MYNDQKEQAFAMQKGPALETFGSMLERLASVINDTQNHVGGAEKIARVTLESVQRLGFMPSFAQDGGAIGGEPGAPKDPHVPTGLQRLDALITLLGDTNLWLERVNNEANNTRSALQGQL